MQPHEASAPPLPCLLATTARGSGNRCGHQPAAPRIYGITPPEGRNPHRPDLIEKARARLPDYYLKPLEDRWDDISQTERRQRVGKRIAAVGGPDTPAGRALEAKFKSWRQQRSERREAITAVLSVLLLYTDILTLKVAIPGAHNAWLGINIKWIAARAGLSESRAKRALATLARAGIIETTGKGRRFDPKKGWVYAGWGAIRRLSFRLIRKLGLELSWSREQKRLRKEKQAMEEAQRREQAQDNLAVVRSLIKTSARKKIPGALGNIQDREAAIERSRKAAELALAGVPLEEIKRLLGYPKTPP